MIPHTSIGKIRGLQTKWKTRLTPSVYLIQMIIPYIIIRIRKYGEISNSIGPSRSCKADGVQEKLSFMAIAVCFQVPT